MFTTPKTSQPLVVVVSGGGSVGLTFSLHLTMMMGKHAKIIIYDGRWFVDRGGKIYWQGERQGVRRRDQIVTLQDHVLKQMPEYVEEGLFKNIDECVWPTSQNIPILEVENRLFDLIQPFVQNGQVELIAENLNEQSECLINGNFDVLVGADGSNSFIRRYCNIQTISENIEYACGIDYEVPEKVSPDDEPLHQALNCILSVSQTRYLVNSLESRQGYINIRLLRNEYEDLRDHLSALQPNESLDLSDTSKYPSTPVWTMIRQGLELFKISPKYISRIAPIETNILHACVVVRELHYETNPSEKSVNNPDEKMYKNTLVFLVGDAAINSHFWTGRGMNNGMQAAMALARNILRSCTSNNSIQIRTPLNSLDFLDYEGFIARLRAREQQGRPLRVLSNPIDKCIGTSYSYTNLSQDYLNYTSKLLKRLKDSRKRLQEHPGWPHGSRKITDDELLAATKRVLPQVIEQLSLANPWPTREMNGAEILVENTFPYDVENFLPVPPLNLIKTTRPATRTIHYRFLILWVIGEKQIDIIDRLVHKIQKSPSYIKTAKNKDTVWQLTVVQTAEEAKEWIKSNQELIKKPDILFKVITLWKIKADQTAIDVIRAVRSQVPRAPILIFTNKYGETQSALEFPNILSTDAEYQLKEFVGIYQDAQWNPGCVVKSPETLSLPSDLPPRGASPLPYPLGNSSAIPALPNSDFLPNLSFTTSKRGASDGTIQNSSPSTKPGNLTVAIPNSSSPSKIGFPDITSSNSSSSTVTKHNALTLNTPSSSSPTTVKHGNLNAITPSSSSPKAAKGGFSNMTSLNSCSSQLGSPKVICKVPKLPSMLLWIDNDNCDQKALDYIQKNHPILEIKFLPTFHEAETYLDEHLRDIEERKKFVAICRGYYAPESKNFIDVTRLFEPCASETFKLLVYTSSKVKLLEKTSKPPQGVEIFEKRQELLDFIDSYLVEEMKF